MPRPTGPSSEGTVVFPLTVHRTGVPPSRSSCWIPGGGRTPETRIRCSWCVGKGWLTTYDLPGVYINTRIKHASPLNLFLSFLHFSRWDSSMYMSLYTFLQSWEPTNRTSLSGGGVYTVSVLVASCGPRDALTYGSRAFPGSMTKGLKENINICPLRAGTYRPYLPGTPLHGNLAFILQGRAFLVAP